MRLLPGCVGVRMSRPYVRRRRRCAGSPAGNLRHRVQLADDERAAAVGLPDLDLAKSPGSGQDVTAWATLPTDATSASTAMVIFLTSYRLSSV
jgi:hypothetical protein